MCKGLKPDYKKLERHAVTKKVPEIEALVVLILINMLGRLFLALTSDHWTSNTGTTFLAVTAHVINDEWELVSLTLACSEHKGRTTALDCEKEIRQVMEKYKIAKKRVSALVTDTENTMTAMGKLFDIKKHTYCLAHLLELVTVSILNNSIFLFIVRFFFILNWASIVCIKAKRLFDRIYLYHK